MAQPHDPRWCARLRAGSGGSPEPAPSAPPPASARFFVKREIPAVHECERCGTVMYDHHCKIVCPNCGYKRDCSDP